MTSRILPSLCSGTVRPDSGNSCNRSVPEISSQPKDIARFGWYVALRRVDSPLRESVICIRERFHMHRTNGCYARTNAQRRSIQSGVRPQRLSRSRTKTMEALKKSITRWEFDQTVSSGIGVWTADVKNRHCLSFNREEDAITSGDQMPDGNTQLFALGRDGTSQGQ
jgi:hypothetical protein